MHGVSYMYAVPKFLFGIKKGSTKISFQRRAYKSVDDGSRLS